MALFHLVILNLKEGICSNYSFTLEGIVLNSKRELEPPYLLCEACDHLSETPGPLLLAEVAVAVVQQVDRQHQLEKHNTQQHVFSLYRP